MPTTKSFLTRIRDRFRSSPECPDFEIEEAAPPKNPATVVGAIRRNERWMLCSPDFRQEGVRTYTLVLGEKTIRQYNEAVLAYDAIQDAITAAPKTYKHPRRSKQEAANG